MSLTLILIRHCKSDWTAGLEDHERPLNGRGQRDAPRLGAWMAREGHLPDMAFVSSATRTQATWAAIAEALPAPIRTRYLPRLYHASETEILDVLAGEDARACAVIGHNPGIGALMHRLCAISLAHPRFADVPTGATLVLRFAADHWAEIAADHTGEVVDFITPHDLQAGP